MPRCTLPRQEICIEGKLDVRTVDTRHRSFSLRSILHIFRNILSQVQSLATTRIPQCNTPTQLIHFCRGVHHRNQSLQESFDRFFWSIPVQAFRCLQQVPHTGENSDGFPSSSPSLLLRRHGSKRRKEKLKKAYCSFLVSLR